MTYQEKYQYLSSF